MRRYFFILLCCISLHGWSQARDQNDSTRLKSLTDYVTRNFFSRNNDVESTASEAIGLARRLGDKKRLEDLSRMMGVIQYFNGRYEKALQYYTDAVAIAKEIGDKKGEAATYNELGTFYRKHNRPDQALETFDKAFRLSYEVRDTGGMATAINNSGIAYEVQGDLGTAVLKYKEALGYYQMIGDSVGQSYCFENIGGVYMMLKKFGDAEPYLASSLDLRKRAGLEQAMAFSYQYLGELYQKQGNIARSFAMLDTCLSIATRIHYPDLRQRVYFLMSENYRLKSDFANAYDYYKKGSQLKDSLFNTEKSRQITEMQTRYEVDTKNKENEILRQNNELSARKIENTYLLVALVCLVFAAISAIAVVLYRKRQRYQAIQTQLSIQRAEQQQRIRISHDLHDHVGAQLSYVVSNLDMATQEIEENRLAPKRLDAITDMSKQAINTLRETVWALNKESISVESFADKFKAYAQKMSELREDAETRFNEEIRINNVLQPNTALNLFRICQEAYSNALRHSGCKKINIQIISDDRYDFIFRLEDDGTGFDVEEARRKGHFGLGNMQHRAKESGAVYTLDTGLGEGTRISLVLPKNSTYV